MSSRKIEKQLPRRVQRFIAEYGLIEKSGPLMVGVSGGADSVCLLHVFFQLRDELDLDLHVVHLNHQLRGAESDADAEYVSHLAQKLGIAATIQKRDVRRYQDEKRCSLEEAAREVRYAFFAEVAQSIGAGAVAVGHTADDQAETILIHLIRGTGLSGLRGMQPLSRWRLFEGSQLTVIRPLLEISREETEAYCAAYDLSPRTDSSNVSSKYLRNRIRFELMPQLLEYNPNIREGLSRAARMIVVDMAHIDEEVVQLWGSVVEELPHGISLNNKAFSALSPALQRHLLRSVLERLLGSLRDVESIHIENVVKVLSKPAGKRLSMPYGLTFYGDYDESLITEDEGAPCPLPPLGDVHKLAIPGETVFSAWQVRAEVIENRFDSIDAAGYQACLDFNLAGADLIVRSRRDGDRFQPLGMSEAKKLQDFMGDAKIPRAWRDRVPLVCSGDRILWVVGWRIDHRVRVTDLTERILRLEFENWF